MSKDVLGMDVGACRVVGLAGDDTAGVFDKFNTRLPVTPRCRLAPPGGPIHKNQFFSALDGVFTIFLNGNMKNCWRFAQKTHFIDNFCIYVGPSTRKKVKI